MSNDITIVSKAMPAHAKASAGLGNENISSEHMMVPRVKQLQRVSNEVDENHSDYVQGAKVGDFINTVTRENYGKSIYVINVYFKEEYVVWGKREKGEGLIGAYASRDEAISGIEAAKKLEEDCEITQTQTHTLLRVDETTGKVSDIPFLFDCAASKLRVSREWNTQIAKLGGDRFSSLWKMESVETANKVGQKFMNISVTNVGWVKDDTHASVKTFYDKTFNAKALESVAS